MKGETIKSFLAIIIVIFIVSILYTSLANKGVKENSESMHSNLEWRVDDLEQKTSDLESQIGDLEWRIDNLE